MDGIRIDKWLWAARFFRTRGRAQEAVRAGHVHIEGKACKPSRAVAAGDRLEIVRGRERFEVVVRELSDRRGPAPEARALYEETAESIERRERVRSERRDAPVDGGRRPDKRDRRRLRRISGKG
ncbi:MAG: RNA-binding S4 domain-containing protein [Wenzhouxiangellaceae bacterium]|nr:RNA-binding S4 domain-containing protein [Wenzhouxiangellaceae bacterium]